MLRINLPQPFVELTLIRRITINVIRISVLFKSLNNWNKTGSTKMLIFSYFIYCIHNKQLVFLLTVSQIEFMDYLDNKLNSLL